MLLFFLIDLVCVISFKEKEATQFMIIFLFFHPYYLHQTGKETFMTVKELFQLADFKRITDDMSNDDGELNNDRTISEGERKKRKKDLAEYIYGCYLSMMQVDPVVDNEKVVFCSWHIDLKNPEDSYMHPSLLQLDDILTKKIYEAKPGKHIASAEYEQNYIQKYAFEFDPWNRILGYQVANASILRYGIDKVSKAIYDEMTFFGYDIKSAEAKSEKEMNAILKAAEDIQNNPQEGIPAEKVFSDLYERFGITPPTKEEREQRRRRMLDELKINQAEENLVLMEIQKEYRN